MLGELKNPSHNPTPTQPITRGRHERRPQQALHPQLHPGAVSSARRASADVAWRYGCVVVIELCLRTKKWVSCEGRVLAHSGAAATAAAAASSEDTDTQRLGRSFSGPGGRPVRGQHVGLSPLLHAADTPVSRENYACILPKTRSSRDHPQASSSRTASMNDCIQQEAHAADPRRNSDLFQDAEQPKKSINLFVP